jgi:hypothetical protein
MGSLTLNGATSGQITLNPPAVAGTTAISLPAITGGSFIVSDSSGNVGVGTTTPATKFNVVGATGVTMRIEENTSGSNNRGDFSANSTTVAIGSKSNTPFIINTNDTERARIDTSGYMQGTVNGLGAGRIPAMQYFRLNSDLAGANATGAQNTFGVGVTLVGSTQYAFDASIVLTKTAGATSHTIAIGFGGTATVNNILYQGRSNYTASTLPFGLNGGGYDYVTNSTSSLVVTTALASATYFFQAHFKGTISINAGGTFIPQYTLSAAPGGAYSTVAGSYFAIYPLAASGSNVSIGTWA